MEASRVTQRDVALRAGVSQATVSQWLNGNRAALAAETAERVERAVADLGYRPNRAAQALRVAPAPVIACVVPDLTNPFYPALVAGVQGLANEADCDVVAVNTQGRRELEEAVVRGAAQGRYDGIVGVFFALTLADFRPLLRAGVAVARVEAARKPGGPLPLDDVFVDNRAAAREATEALVALGHRRVAMIAGAGGPQGERVEGYRAAMLAAGAAPLVQVDPWFNEAGGRRAARRLRAQGARPTAILAANDLMAIGAMQALAAEGLSVPGDVSVAGFDDIMAADLVTPRLSTVALHQDALGRMAAGMVVERLKGGHAGPGRAVEMPFAVVPRDSTAPPRVEGAGRGQHSAEEETT